MPEAKWIKSSYSGESANNCVEVASLTHRIAVRDSKRPARAVLFGADAFAALVKSL